MQPDPLTVWQRRNKPHFVYRCYDADGTLIYIGLTSDVERRMEQHRANALRTSPWGPDIARFDWTEYPDWWSGANAESIDIYQNQPVYNVQSKSATIHHRRPDAPIALPPTAKHLAYLRDQARRPAPLGATVEVGVDVLVWLIDQASSTTEQVA